MLATHQEVVLGGVLHHPPHVAHRAHVVVVENLAVLDAERGNKSNIYHNVTFMNLKTMSVFLNQH